MKLIKINGIDFAYNLEKSFEREGHIYCRACGEQKDSEPINYLGDKKIIISRQCKCDREEGKIRQATW